MLGRLWPRFALEALFLIAVALVAGLLDFSVTQVILVMAVAYLLTVALELGAWQSRRRSSPAAETAPPAEEVTVLEPAGAAVTVRSGDRPPRPEEEETWVDPLPAAAGLQEPEPEPEPEPLPTAEPQPPEPQPEVEHEPEPAAALPQLTAVPEPEPEPEQEQEQEPEPVAAAVATLPLPAEPREWNLWELERLTRERAGEDDAREVEWAYLIVYLRDFARPDGTLPTEFDDLVRESFGDLLAARAP